LNIFYMQECVEMLIRFFRDKKSRPM